MSSGQQRRDALGAILKRNGLSEPSGRPLYSLLCEDGEYETLRSALRPVLEIRELYEDIEAAGFCLVVAEWIRRDHTDGAINWRTILQSAFTVPQRMLERHLRKVRDYTRDGMDWWRRPLVALQYSTRYQTTLACEGGLPLHLLHDDQGVLTRYFRAVLRDFERYPNESLSTLVEFHDGVLRESLRNDVVHGLAIGLIRSVCALRKQLLRWPSSANDPVAALNRHLPKWRSTLPLRVDDGIAHELLLGLLREPPAGSAVSSATPSVRTVLERTGAAYRIGRYFTSPPELSVDAMATLFSTREELPPRLQFILKGGGERITVAKAIRRHGQESYRIEVLPDAGLTGESALPRAQLIAALGIQEVAACDIPGGDPLPDGIWVFDDPGGSTPSDYLGSGSVKTRTPTLLVATSKDELEFIGVRPTIEPVGMIGGTARRLIRITGDASFTQDDAIIRLRTQTPPESIRSFELRGRRCQLGPSGSEVWLGVPEIWERVGDGEVTIVSPAHVEWRPSRHASNWRPIGCECLGEIRLRIVRSDELVWQQQAVVFPTEFRIKVVGGPSMNEGRLEFRNTRAQSLSAYSSEQFTADVQKDAGAFSVSVHRLRGNAPLIKVRVQFGAETAAEVAATCPAPTVLIVDAAERICATEAPIPIELLPRLRIHAVFPDAGRPIVLGPDDRRLAQLHPIDDGSYAYNLPLSLLRDRVAGLLATNSDPQGWVDLRIRSHRHASAGETRLRICRHAGAADRPRLSDQDFVAVNVPDAVLSQPWCDADSAHLELSAIGRSDCMAPAEAIAPVGPGRWDLEMTRCDQGTWLATVWLGSGVCLHPFAVSGRASSAVDVECQFVERATIGFDQALEIADPRARLIAWRHVIEQLASQPLHPDWGRMDDLLKQATKLPVTTFDATCALVSNPTAVALAGIRHVRSEKLWTRLQELPFLWATISVGDWVRAWKLHWEPQLRAVDELLGPDPITKDDLRKSIALNQKEFMIQSQSHVPGMACIQACIQVAGLASLAAGDVERLMPGAVPMIVQEVSELRTRVVAGHNDDDWPGFNLFVPEAVRPHVRKLGLWECAGYQRAVLQAPVLAAWHSAMNQHVSHSLVRDFHQLRGFDTDWFDRVHEQAMFLVAGNRLRHNPQCYHPSVHPEEQNS